MKFKEMGLWLLGSCIWFIIGMNIHLHYFPKVYGIGVLGGLLPFIIFLIVKADKLKP